VSIKGNPKLHEKYFRSCIFHYFYIKQAKLIILSFWDYFLFFVGSSFPYLSFSTMRAYGTLFYCYVVFLYTVHHVIPPGILSINPLKKYILVIFTGPPTQKRRKAAGKDGGWGRCR
jgi:hypothetical protein